MVQPALEQEAAAAAGGGVSGSKHEAGADRGQPTFHGGAADLARRSVGSVSSHTELIGMAAHDLRNPLTVILSLSELLLSDPTLSLAERSEFVEMIRSHAHDMRRLIEDLLEISRIDSGKLELHLRPIGADAFVTEIVEGFRPRAEQKNIAVATEIAPGIKEVWLDRERIRQVLGNLLDNALKFSDSGTSVTVAVVPAGSWVEFSVLDQGPGITPEELETVFEAFESGSNRATGGESSTGLGLAICRRLIEMHGGTISVESSHPVGSRFYFRLPAQQPIGIPAQQG
jgi:signal transduction histidine kinase